jgi:tol-pal system protein YbgF
MRIDMRRIFTLLFATALVSPADAEVKNQGQGNVQYQIEQLQDEIRSLRGQVEELSHLVKTQNHGINTPKDMPAPKPSVSPTKNLADESPSLKSTMLEDQPTNSSGSRLSPTANSTNDYNEARTLLDQRRFAEAEVALTQFIKKYPKDPLLVNAHYWLGETHYIRSDYTEAAMKFGEAYQAYLDHKKGAYKEQAMNKGPEIMFKLASSLYNIGKYEDAKTVLDEMGKEFKQLPGNIRQQADLLRKEMANKPRAS